MRNRGIALLFLCASLVAVGCAAPTDGEDATAADQALTEYDGVAKNGRTKVDSDTTPNESYSAKTRLVGFIPSAEVDAVAGELLKMDKWTGIKDSDGNKPFDAATIKNDSTNGDVRTLTGKVTLDGGIALDIKAIARKSEDKTTIKFANTTGYKHWLAGQVLDPGKLTIDVTLVPLKGGVIVDATMKVKLNSVEDKAAGFCAALPLVFDWLKARSS